MKPKKELGQNFLFDNQVLTAIASCGGLTSDDTVLEIGPGLGTLTSRLCHQAGRVVAVEFDPELAPQLDDNVADLTAELYGVDLSDRLTVYHDDILRFNLDQLPKNYKVVANIPYNLTSKIIEKLWTVKNKPAIAVLLVQKEVAERLAAEAGDLSVIAVATNIYAEVSTGIKVGAEMFTPPPKVDSMVVIMKRRDQQLVDDGDVEQFMYVVRAGFSEKRKKLRSSLAVGLRTSKQEAERLLTDANIDPNKRAQELAIDDWKRLARVK